MKTRELATETMGVRVSALIRSFCCELFVSEEEAVYVPSFRISIHITLGFQTGRTRNRPRRLSSPEKPAPLSQILRRSVRNANLN